MRLHHLPIILLIALIVAGCAAPADEVPTAVAVVSATETAAPVVTSAPTETAVPTVTSAPTETAIPTEPPATETPAGPVADSCLSCHSNQQLLISTASPVEEKESSESSGVG